MNEQTVTWHNGIVVPFSKLNFVHLQPRKGQQYERYQLDGYDISISGLPGAYIYHRPGRAGYWVACDRDLIDPTPCLAPNGFTVTVTATFTARPKLDSPPEADAGRGGDVHPDLPPPGSRRAWTRSAVHLRTVG